MDVNKAVGKRIKFKDAIESHACLQTQERKGGFSVQEIINSGNQKWPWEVTPLRLRCVGFMSFIWFHDSSIRSSLYLNTLWHGVVFFNWGQVEVLSKSLPQLSSKVEGFTGFHVLVPCNSLQLQPFTIFEFRSLKVSWKSWKWLGINDFWGVIASSLENPKPILLYSERDWIFLFLVWR